MSNTTLEQATHAFAEWRSQRSGKSRTPDHLKAMAVSLLANYTCAEICKRLSLNSGTLKSWQPEEISPTPTEDFVSLSMPDVLPRQGDIQLHISTPAGFDCKLSGALEPAFIASLLRSVQGGLS